MDNVRHILGVLLVVTFPPAVIYWLLIHPFASCWRRVGAAGTYLTVVPLSVGFAAVLYRFRLFLLGRDLGTSWIFFGLGIFLYLGAIHITVLARRQLSVRQLTGVPEIKGGDVPQAMLEEGIYARVRHPRYLSVYLGTLGIALIANHVGAYLLTLILFSLLYLVIVLEERELRQRFGRRYGDYQRRVPRLVPRWRGRRGGG